jgi:putative oxidoreductase
VKSNFQDIQNLVGRVFIAALFVPAGISKVMSFAGTVGYITSVGMPLPELSAFLAILIEIISGVGIAIGFQTQISALILAFFTLVASIIFHPYWAVPADQAFVTQLLFFKNIAVIGGLLIIASKSPGKFSIDQVKIN